MGNKYRVLIVGAGVAGLYAAWRLCIDAAQTTGLQPSDAVIYEVSPRTCGRLFTQDLNEFGSAAYPLPRDSGLRAELGGMRFQNYHIYVGYLARKLGLPYVNFPADVLPNWHYLRGTAIQTQNWGNQTTYALADAEENVLKKPGGTPGTIVGDALVEPTGPVVKRDWLPKPDGSVTLRDLVNSVMAAGYGGAPLWHQGFWNLLVSDGQHGPSTTASISNEAYELFVDTGAYDTIPSDWNAGNAVVDMVADFAGQPQYYALTKGYMELPTALQQRLPKDMIQTGKQVVSINSSGTGYTVTFADNATATADNVILALPPRSLQLINLPTVPVLANQLQQSTPIPLFKIFLVYKTPGNTGP